jgi:hypothetical protein
MNEEEREEELREEIEEEREEDKLAIEGNPDMKKYFDSIFELQAQLLELKDNSNVEKKKNFMTKEVITSNITPDQEKNLLYILDFIGELQQYGIEDAAPVFNIKADAILNLSRSRNGFQQNMFVTQNIKHDKKIEKTENKRRWF